MDFSTILKSNRRKIENLIVDIEVGLTEDGREHRMALTIGADGELSIYDHLEYWGADYLPTLDPEKELLIGTYCGQGRGSYDFPNPRICGFWDMFKAGKARTQFFAERKPLGNEDADGEADAIFFRTKFPTIYKRVIKACEAGVKKYARENAVRDYHLALERAQA